MYQPVKLLYPLSKPEAITINQEPLVQATDFTYLGSTVSSSSKIDKEIEIRKDKANIAFIYKLQQRLCNSRHVSIRVEFKVYRAVVL